MFENRTSIADSASALAGSAVHAAEGAIGASRRLANDTLDDMSDRIDEVQVQAGRFAGDAGRLARRGVAAVRVGSQRLRYQAVRATDSTVGYIREKPVRSVLIAAATGAALMGLLTLVSRVSGRRR